MFAKFDRTIIKTAIVVGIAKAKFPGVTEEFLNGFKEWMNTEEGWEWILEQRKSWEERDDSNVPEVGVDKTMHGYKYKKTSYNNGAKISCDGVDYDKMTFPGVGPDYGSQMLIIWENGQHLFVDDTTQMRMLSSGRKYQPGGQYSKNYDGTPNNPDIPTMEVYCDKGDHSKSVTIYYNGK